MEPDKEITVYLLVTSLDGHISINTFYNLKEAQKWMRFDLFKTIECEGYSEEDCNNYENNYLSAWVHGHLYEYRWDIVPHTLNITHLEKFYVSNNRGN